MSSEFITLLKKKEIIFKGSKQAEMASFCNSYHRKMVAFKNEDKNKRKIFESKSHKK